MTLTQNITLDVARETALHIAGKQFDENSRFLLVTIKEAGEEKSVPAGSTITLNARRPDGSAQSFAGSIQDGKAFVEIDQWILEQYGTVYCSISVVDSEAAKLTTLSFRLLVERAEGSGFVLVYVAAANLPAGTYYITMAGVNYSFTTTQAVPAGGKIYFSSVGTTGKTTNNGATIETLTLTAGSTGTELQGSDIVNFLTQMQANVAAIAGELDSKADKSAVEENLAAGTSLATIDKDSYTPNTSPYLHRISPSGKRCEYDVIGGTVGWNQYCNEYPTTTTQGITLTNDGNGKLTASGASSAGGNHYFMHYSANRPIYQNHKYFVTIGDLSANNTAAVNFRNRTTNTNYVNANIASSHPQYTICNAADDGIMYYYLNFPNANTTITGTICPMVIDLTTLLGSTIADYAYQLEQNTAGSGIAWLKSFGFLTKSYYPFSEPTLESVQATARVARGINQWDEEWEIGNWSINNGEHGTLTDRIRTKNLIPVFPNASYYFTCPTSFQGGRCCAYDANKTFIGLLSLSDSTLSSNASIVGGAVFTMNEKVHYIAFNGTTAYGTTYKNDVCINISNPTINGTYYPYESHTYPLGNTTLRGIPKLDSSNNIYYDGDKRKSDGTVNRRFLLVDLGSLNWTKAALDGNAYYSNSINEVMAVGNVTTANVICAKYDLYMTGNGSVMLDKTYRIGGTYIGTRRVTIRDDSYTTASAFKAAMSGVYLLAEAATPTTETTDSFTPIQYTGSTEAFTTSNDVPVGVDAKYYTDLTLPKLPTANGTYTLKCTVTDGTGIVSWVSE